jgi:putative transposase
LVEPLTGESFFLELSNTDTKCFQVFLEEFSLLYPSHCHIIPLDNASFHTAKKLKIPDNIVLFFQPVYSPELNPIERVWQWIKEQLSWKIFSNLDALKDEVAEILKNATKNVLASLSGWQTLMTALKSAGF